MNISLIQSQIQSSLEFDNNQLRGRNHIMAQKNLF